MQRPSVAENGKYSLRLLSDAKSEDFDLLFSMKILDKGTCPPFNYSSTVEQKEWNLCALLNWV